MTYYLYKLKFNTPVRFGLYDFVGNLSKAKMTLESDALFSAIFMEWISIFGVESSEKLIEASKNGSFYLTDTFPYEKNTYYISKPMLYIEKEEKDDEEESSSKKKKAKKIQYIPIDKIEWYIEAVKKNEDISEKIENTFGSYIFNIRASVTYEEETVPYGVRAFVFNKEAGLYFISYTDEETHKKLLNVLKSLGYAGIGGKRSTGYGKFKVESKKIKEGDVFYKLLQKEEATHYVSLSSVYPKEEDIEKLDLKKSYYSLIKRSGYVNSLNYAPQYVKKADVMFFKSGSSFNVKLEGDVIDVQKESKNAHPVYRFGKGMFIGVSV